MTKAAIIQMTSTADLKLNLQTAESFIVAAKENGASLVVLPENFCFMGLRETDKFAVAEAINQGYIQKALSTLAKKYQLWIVGGSIPLKGSQQRIRASCLVYDSAGKLAARYDKIHLFDVYVDAEESYAESKTIEPGRDIVVVDTPIGRLGLSICYDLRFPELYRALSLKGAEIFAVPSAFTAKTGKAHWHTLLKARAIENLSYVLAANQWGVHQNGRQTYGHSLILDPWGEKLAELSTKSGQISAAIDLPYLLKLRKNFPTLQHHVLEK